MSTAIPTHAIDAPFPHRHLLTIDGLKPREIIGLLDLAERWAEINRQINKKRDTLRGRVVDWTTSRPVPGALVVAVLEPDSLGYRTAADSQRLG